MIEKPPIKKPLISRTSVGLAVRAAREAAGLTLNDLAGITGITPSSLSRSETGQRDLAYAEVLAIAQAARINDATLRMLAETFEREGAATMRQKDLNDLQRLAIETAIEAREVSDVLRMELRNMASELILAGRWSPERETSYMLAINNPVMGLKTRESQSR